MIAFYVFGLDNFCGCVKIKTIFISKDIKLHTGYLLLHLGAEGENCIVEIHPEKMIFSKLKSCISF
jgi:hypothetical protein